jgi:hypothetical protein
VIEVRSSYKSLNGDSHLNLKEKKTNFDLSTLSDVFWVADVSALSDFTHLIKKGIKSQKLIVVVPDIVISEIDPLKVFSFI